LRERIGHERSITHLRIIDRSDEPVWEWFEVDPPVGDRPY
jgi:hypothetical protein